MEIWPFLVRGILSTIAFTLVGGFGAYSVTHSIAKAIIAGSLIFAVMGGIYWALFATAKEDPSMLRMKADTRVVIIATVLQYGGLGWFLVPVPWVLRVVMFFAFYLSGMLLYRRAGQIARQANKEVTDG